MKIWSWGVENHQATIWIISLLISEYHSRAWKKNIFFEIFLKHTNSRPHCQAVGEDPKWGPIEDSRQEVPLHATGFEPKSQGPRVPVSQGRASCSSGVPQMNWRKCEESSVDRWLELSPVCCASTTVLFLVELIVLWAARTHFSQGSLLIITSGLSELPSRSSFRPRFFSFYFISGILFSLQAVSQTCLWDHVQTRSSTRLKLISETVDGALL
jgi:hypothetical protein